MCSPDGRSAGAEAGSWVGPTDQRDMSQPPAARGRILAEKSKGARGAWKGGDSVGSGPVHKIGFLYGTGNEISSWKGGLRRTPVPEREGGVSGGTDLHTEAERRAQQLKYSKRLKEQMQEQFERRTQEVAERKGPADVFYPFGQGQPLRDDSGKLVRRKATLRKDIVSDGTEQSGLAFQLGCHGGGGGAPHRDKHGNIVAVRRCPQQQQDPSQSECEGYNPWGRPGCGAPKRSKHGQIEAARTAALCRETDSARTVLWCSQEKQRYLQQLRHGMQHRDTDVPRKTQSEGVEVASWIRSGQVGQPPVDPTSGEFRGANRAMSDVVRAKLALRRPVDSECYYLDLQRQAEERHRSRAREKEEDRRLAQQHILATEKMWSVERRMERNPRHYLEMDRKLEEKRAAYGSELYRQARSKRVEAQMEREQGLKEEKEHVDVFNSQWGRPGGGAPKQGSQGRQAKLMPPFAVTRRRS